MAGPIAILRELHRLRRFAADLQSRIDQAPRALKAQQARVARQEEVLRQAQEGIKRLKVTIHEKEVSLKTTLQQVAKHEKQREEAASKKEYDAFQVEITSAKKKVQQLEDEILDAMGRAEEEAAKVPEFDRALKQVKEEVARYESDTASRLAGFTAELAQARQQIAEVEATLPAEVRPLYNRLVTAKGEDALAAVQGRTCTACYTDITAQQFNELAMGNFVMCKMCGRILYLPEE